MNNDQIRKWRIAVSVNQAGRAISSPVAPYGVSVLGDMDRMSGLDSSDRGSIGTKESARRYAEKLLSLWEYFCVIEPDCQRRTAHRHGARAKVARRG
jgi:hypothetical protein